jgi:transcriptional regulator with XRE-family HTH domain
MPPTSVTEAINPIDTYVGGKIRCLRAERQITRYQLALLLGVTPETIDAFEAGHRRVGAERLIAIAHALAVPIAHFYSDIGLQPLDRTSTS